MALPLFGLFTLGFGFGSMPAFANGQRTHIWISMHALEHLPAGELYDILSAPENQEALINGSMFPDGGYAFGEPYGEAAHWEGFQNHYMAYFIENYPPPWDAEARLRVAYMMGMGSHGMADQIFDAMYLSRAKEVFDADSDWNNDEDEATDVAFTALVGPQDVVPVWFPPEFPDRFAELGIETTTSKLTQGQTALGIAITYIGNRSQDQTALADYALQFPWATSHLMEDVPGAPTCEGEIIARYWQHLWKRLQGDNGLNAGPLAIVPDIDTYGHPISASNIDSMVSIVMPRGLETVSVGDFDVIGPDGSSHPLKEPWLYYNNGSHVVNLRPETDWLPNTDYTVVVKGGLRSFDGLVFGGPWEMPFHTHANPPSKEEAAGCRCQHSSLGGFAFASAFAGLLVFWRREGSLQS